jgi:hypothetical protein
MGLFESGLGLVGKAKENKLNKKAAEAARKERNKLMETMDFEPMYASERTPTYQKSESPVARAYLESFLLGNNPNATFSGSPNGAAMKGVQQRQQNSLFGTPQQRVARQQQLQTETPWKVAPPERKIVGAEDAPAQWATKYPQLLALGIETPEQYQDYVKRSKAAGGMPLVGDIDKAENSAWTQLALKDLQKREKKGADPFKKLLEDSQKQSKERRARGA